MIEYPVSASAGCSTPPAEPVEGDVRLVPLNGTTSATAECDPVHFGGVELFREGRWGRICSGRNLGGEPEQFTLVTQVVCRQLGFPFGTVMDSEDFDDAYEQDFSAEVALTWATRVRLHPFVTIAATLGKRPELSEHGCTQTHTLPCSHFSPSQVAAHTLK